MIDFEYFQSGHTDAPCNCGTITSLRDEQDNAECIACWQARQTREEKPTFSEWLDQLEEGNQRNNAAQ